jgi:pyruvate/2-oxoglutarate dehydrogenase complex dihydrolipoamide dehydrogenase (E3) component
MRDFARDCVVIGSAPVGYAPAIAPPSRYHVVARIVHGHPTLSEAVMEAARAADGWLIHG